MTFDTKSLVMVYHQVFSSSLDMKLTRLLKLEAFAIQKRRSQVHGCASGASSPALDHIACKFLRNGGHSMLEHRPIHMNLWLQ
jgi:hypothetical protein